MIRHILPLCCLLVFSLPAFATPVFLGFSTENGDNPSQPAQLDAIRDVINANLDNFLPSIPITSDQLQLVDKDETNNDNDNSFFVTGIGANTGTYQFSGAPEISILTLKSGNNPVEIYALTSSCQTGGWTNHYQQALSHVSVWRIDGAVAVPEPTPLLLMGLIGTGLLGWRKLRPNLPTGLAATRWICANSTLATQSNVSANPTL